MIKKPLRLSPDDQAHLEQLLAKGQLPARVFRRATGLLELHRGKTLKAVATTLDVSRVAVAEWRDKYRRHGLHCLRDEPRPGRPIKIDGHQQAKITALACSDPPQGHARWDLRLLADKVVELGYCDAISHTLVGQILKKMCSSPT